MLKSFRNKRLMQIVMWSLVVIFGAWGIGSISASGRLYAGSIFGKKISAQEYNRNYSAVLNRARMMYGEELPKVEKFLDLKNQAWDRLILLHEARKRHISATNKDIIAKIAGFPFFQRNNIFDRGLYEYITASVFRVTPHEFEESIRGDIMIEKLVSQITQDISVTDEEARQAYSAEKELADISFIIISPEDYVKDISVNESDMLSFYNNNPEKFLSPVMVNAEYIMIPFTEQTKENAAFIADELRDLATQGKTLSELSEAYGLDLKETGDFSIDSEIPSIGISYAFALAAFTLEKGEISPVVELPESFCLISLKSKSGPGLLDFKLVVNKAKDMLIYETASEMALKNALDIISRMQKNRLSMEDIAKNNNYTIHKSERISRKSHVAEAGQSEDLMQIAFSLADGEIGGPAKTQKGYAIIRLDAIIPIDEELYAQEKNTFIERLYQTRQSEFFKNWFIELKQEAMLEDKL
jgi:hypothetical protein